MKIRTYLPGLVFLATLVAIGGWIGLVAGIAQDRVGAEPADQVGEFLIGIERLGECLGLGGKSGEPAKTNYWVRFEMDEIWGGKGRYAAKDTVVAEIYEHWLEAA